MVHELVHAFDFARAEIDACDIAHVACTEIRAYNLSEQCDPIATWNVHPDFYSHGPLTEAILKDELRRPSIQGASVRRITTSQPDKASEPGPKMSNPDASKVSLSELGGVAFDSAIVAEMSSRFTIP